VTQGSAPRRIVPPFDAESAVAKVRMAEDAWNSRDPERVSMAYSPDSRWRNRAEFFSGREAIVAFLQRKWTRELAYRLIKEIWACGENRIAVRFVYEYHDHSGSWFRAHGNEQREFGADGLMQRREASINDVPIDRGARKFDWPLGPRPESYPGLTELGL
jgi:nuclear transport factor 2 (NTF2) superfamily protein